MKITCIHCGVVPVTDTSQVLATRSVLHGLRTGGTTLGAITCPNCRSEVRARDVQDFICAWCPDFDPKSDINRGASHGICPSCEVRMREEMAEYKRREQR